MIQACSLSHNDTLDVEPVLHAVGEGFQDDQILGEARHQPVCHSRATQNARTPAAAAKRAFN